METAVNILPEWMTTYWVGVTLVRLVIMLVVVIYFGRTVSGESKRAKNAAVWASSIFLLVWVGALMRLGSMNALRITPESPLPPPILAAALVPILIAYLAFEYWEPFRRLVFNIPQHWLILLQAYRITGGIFLLVFAMGLIPGAFALVAGTGDLVTGLLAIPVAWAVYKQKPWARKGAFAWNYLGLFELILLIPLGMLSSPTRIQTLALGNPNLVTSAWPSVLAPTFHVSLGIILHIFSLAKLRQESPARKPVKAQKIGWQLMLLGAITITAYAGIFYVMTPLLTPKPTAFQVYKGLGDVLRQHPIMLYTHILAAMLTLIIGPFQFLGGFRARHPRTHRTMGKIYLVTVFVGGIGAIYLAQFSFAGIGARLGFSVQGSLLLFTGYMAYSHIRRGEVKTHREWMIRNYALIFGAVTLRIYIRTFFALGLTLPDFHAINAWLCWAPNLLVAEWIIRRTRAKTQQPIPLQATAEAGMGD